MGKVSNYQDAFDSQIWKLNLPEDYLISCYMVWVKDKISEGVWFSKIGINYKAAASSVCSHVFSNSSKSFHLISTSFIPSLSVSTHICFTSSSTVMSFISLVSAAGND